MRGRHVCLWHLTDNPAAPAFVRYWGNSGQPSIGALQLLGARGQASTYQTVALRLYWSVDGRVERPEANPRAQASFSFDYSQSECATNY
jgi:hypothetical protein